MRNIKNISFFLTYGIIVLVKHMKRIKYILLLVCCIFTLSSCSILISTSNTTTQTTKTSYTTLTGSYTLPDSDNPGGIKITFDLGDGKTYETTTTKSNYVLTPNDPQRPFATFKGWYYNNEPFNFNNKVTQEITIKAVWEYDYTELVNYIYKNTIKACVKIETYASNNSFFSRVYSDSIGSGIIFDEDSTYYYCLTNNHVVYYDSSKYSSVEYRVYDCYQNVYGDSSIKNYKHTALIGALPEYDLALLKFEKGEKELTVVNMADNSKAELVFSLGNPKSLANAISFGETTGYKTFTPKEETIEKSNVTFDVLTHTSEIDNGSSGGALLNYNLELVGINFASSVASSTGEFIRGYAIPIEKVKEFIERYKA